MGNEIIYWDGLKLMNSYEGNPNPFSVKQLNIQISITVQIHDRTLNALKFLCFGVYCRYEYDAQARSQDFSRGVRTSRTGTK